MGLSLNDVFDAFIEVVAERVQERVGIAEIRKLKPPGLTVSRLLTVKQAAVYLGRTESAVRALRASGRVRAVKLDGRVQFDRAELDVFVENSKV
jgi:excisionase family DNA binding protein